MTIAMQSTKIAIAVAMTLSVRKSGRNRQALNKRRLPH